MSRCWDWCTKDHEHSFDSNDSSFFVRPDYLPKKERDLIYEQSGVRVDSRSDMDKKLVGKRILERGEPGDRMRRDVQEWQRSGGEQSGVPAPRMTDYMPRPSVKNPVDIRRVFRENLERAKSKHGY